MATSPIDSMIERPQQAFSGIHYHRSRCHHYHDRRHHHLHSTFLIIIATIVIVIVYVIIITILILITSSFFIHSFVQAISIAPLQVHLCSETLPTTAVSARILCWSFTPKRHRQLQVNDLPTVPTWWL